MKTIILCGGQGTRLQEATGGLKPKPMVEVGGRPILWHIMDGYARQGFKEFVLCLGHLGAIIKEYFLHYEAMNSDFTLNLGASDNIIYHRHNGASDWQVTLSDTGLDSMTGARVARVRQYIGDETFMVTYGDGLSNINLSELLAFHRAHGKIATITGIQAPSRFGRLMSEQNIVTSFLEKPTDESEWINGGFFVFEPAVFDYLSEDARCVLEQSPMEQLVRHGELAVFKHSGFWQCVDTFRELQLLERLWTCGDAPWRELHPSV